MDDRRTDDRRKGDRRIAPRNGPDRRRGDRRQIAAAAAMTVSFLCFESRGASAQIYTRVNAKGIIEATDSPAVKAEYKLAYPKRKGVVIHSPEFKLRPSSHAEFNDHIETAAAWHGVSVPFVRAVIQTESQFDPRAVSSVGAQGLMQLMPATARRFGVVDPFDPQQNIFGGVRYLRWLLDKFGGNQALAAAGYNAGENAVVRYGGVPPYRETQGYVRKILGILNGAGAEVPVVATMASYTPGGTPVGGVAVADVQTATSGGAATGAAAKQRPKKLRTMYRWKDSRGVPHMTETPPAEGEYQTLRASD
jgi:soluble lytic murein transglycosylase-like protein